MNVKDLKAMADQHGLEYPNNATTERMMGLLADNDIHIEMPAKTETYSTSDHDLKGIALKLKNAGDQISVRQGMQELTQLKNKLKAKKDVESLKKVLKWERSRRLLKEHTADWYMLNELEAEETNDFCTHYRKFNTGAFHAEIGKEYKYSKSYDETRECDLYTFFIDRTIQPEEQITRELDSKINRGFLPQDSDYLPAKTVIHKFQLVEREFYKYFKVDEVVI